MTLTNRALAFSFLMLLAFSIFNMLVLPVHATTYFSSDFETFYLDWTGNGAGGGGTIAKSSTQAHGGTYSGRIYSPSIGAYAYAYKDFTAITSNYHVSAWFWVNATVQTSTNILLFGMWDTTGVGYYTVWCCFANVSGTLYLRNGYGGGKPPTSFQNVAAISASTWYHVDAYIYRGAGNKVAYYLDSVDKGDFTVNNDRSTNRDVLGDTMSTDISGAFYEDDLSIDDTAEPTGGQDVTFILGSPMHIIASITTPLEKSSSLSESVYPFSSVAMWRETLFAQSGLVHVYGTQAIAKEMLFAQTGLIHFIASVAMSKETLALIYEFVLSGLVHPMGSVSLVSKEMIFRLSAVLKPIAVLVSSFEVYMEIYETFQNVLIVPYHLLTVDSALGISETFALALIAFIFAMAAIGLVMLKRRSG